MSPLIREILRKGFHMLSLVFLAAYELIGWPRVLMPMLLWTAFVIALETWRLISPKANRVLTDSFKALVRDDEHDKYSGIMHTTLGMLILWLGFGRHPAIVAASTFYVAFGDASAALVGRAIGRHRLGLSRKTIEGSAACFAACAAVGAAMGFSMAAIVAGAGAATLVESLPTTRWWNDNLWLPVITAAVLRACAVS